MKYLIIISLLLTSCVSVQKHETSPQPTTVIEQQPPDVLIAP